MHYVLLSAHLYKQQMVWAVYGKSGYIFMYILKNHFPSYNLQFILNATYFWLTFFFFFYISVLL